MENTLKATPKHSRHRKNSAIHLVDYEDHLSHHSTQRAAAEEIGVPRGTLRHWKKRKETIAYPQPVVDFLESPAGADFLHRLITAMQFVMTEVGGCGIRLLSRVLELAELHHFVGTSYETLRQRGSRMEENIVAFGETERKRLSDDMPSKKISIAEDETFHPQTCLVAIEPVSNFILLEKYSEKRDAESWNVALEEALHNLPVSVIQSTSDEAKGILNHVQKNLGAHHSPDLFHVQYEISKATGAALSAKERKAHAALKNAEKDVIKRKEYEHSPPMGKGRKPIISKRTITELTEIREVAKKHEIYCTEQRQQVLTSKKAIGLVYHPYDLKTGQSKTSEQLEQELYLNFQIIEQKAFESKLKEVALSKIEKAKRIVPGLVQTLTFYWSMVDLTLKSLALSKELESVMREILISSKYLLMVRKKSKDSKVRQAIRDSEIMLLKRLEESSAWHALPDSEKNRLEKAATECAGYFQRSSSCVEGRNGYLSLRHHGLHHLSPQKLGTLTVIHNFFITRADGTTAAERFFDNKPRDLFEYLIKNMPYPGRAGKRKNLLKLVA